MDSLVLELAKGVSAGVLCGIVCGIALLLLRHLLARSERQDQASALAASRAVELLESQMAARDADLSWTRAKIDALQNQAAMTQTQFLEALREERGARERQMAALERQTEGLLALIERDHREITVRLDGLRDLLIERQAAPGG